MTTYKAEQFESVYEDMTASVQCDCTFITEFVGGQPAKTDGIEQFVRHHLKLEGQEAEAAVKRIAHDEVGAEDVTPEEGEIHEVESYAVNVLRRFEGQPWIGDWMIKACIKQAASRTGLFMEKRGTKGNFAEGGRVRAHSFSIIPNAMPQQIFIVDANGKPAKSEFIRFHGRVNTPKGAQSIVHDSEIVPAGSRFSFIYNFIGGSVEEKDIVRVLALMSNCGLGSVRSMERGRFRIENAEIDIKGLLSKPKSGKKKVEVIPVDDDAVVA